MKRRNKGVLKGMIMTLFIFVAPSFSAGVEPPASVLIDTLSYLYTGVDFDHEQHVDIVGGCSACHHHRFGENIQEERCAKCHSDKPGEFPATCSACHVPEPFSVGQINKMEADPQRYHIDMMGLKAAYHLKCFNCHVETGAPSGCLDCHERTDAGDRFYHSGQYAPVGAGLGGHHD